MMHFIFMYLSLATQISNAYLQFLKGPGTRMDFQFVKDMPMPAQSASDFQFDIASLFGSLFYSWVALLLLPVSFVIYISICAGYIISTSLDSVRSSIDMIL